MNYETFCVICRRPMVNETFRSACVSCVPPDEEAGRREVHELQHACEKRIAAANRREVERLSDALQKIALLGDTGIEDFKKEFGDGPGTINGWRVAERMREIALDAISLGK